MTDNNELNPSWKKILGSALLGLYFGGFILNSFEEARMRIFENSYFSDSTILNIDVSIGIIMWICAILIGAFIAALLSRKKGIIAALIANSLYILGLPAIFIFAAIKFKGIPPGALSNQFIIFLGWLSIILITIIGGYLGQKFYSRERDPDINNDKLTVFGIRWFHYFWMGGAVFYPTLVGALVAIYTLFISTASVINHLTNRAIWHNLFANDSVIWLPFGSVISLLVLWFGITKFWETLSYKRKSYSWWARTILVILFGIGAPILSWPIATMTLFTSYELPKPDFIDWIITFVLLISGTIFFVVYKIRNTNNLNKNYKSPILGSILGLVFGAFSSIYFGWQMFLTTILTLTFVALLVAFISPFQTFSWLWIILNIFFAFYNYILANVFNESLNEGVDIKEIIAMNALGLSTWLTRIIVTSTGLYAMVIFFLEGRYLIAILTPLLIIPIVIWVLDLIISTIIGILGGILSR